MKFSKITHIYNTWGPQHMFGIFSFSYIFMGQLGELSTISKHDIRRIITKRNSFAFVLFFAPAHTPPFPLPFSPPPSHFLYLSLSLSISISICLTLFQTHTHTRTHRPTLSEIRCLFASNSFTLHQHEHITNFSQRIVYAFKENATSLLNNPVVSY